MPASRTDVIVALAAPAAVVAFDLATGAYEAGETPMWFGVDREQSATLLSTLTVAKVAALAWVVGRGVKSAPLRVLVFAWCVVLVDLGLYGGLAQFWRPDVVGVALLTSQLGALFCWAILGGARWVWRLPAGLLAVAAILPVGYWTFYRSEKWLPLLTIGIAVQIVVYAAFRFSGFRISTLATGGGDDGVEMRASQFKIKHFLVWSAAMAPLLVAIRSIPWYLEWWVGSFKDALLEWPEAMTLGVVIGSGCLAMVGVTLGPGPAWVRLLVGVAMVAAINSGLSVWSTTRWEQGVAMRSFPPYRSIAWTLIELRDAWLPWCLLAFGLLAALLLFLRASGYRLRRQR